MLSITGGEFFLMRVSNKLQKWVEQGLISQEQAEKIILTEQSDNGRMAWKLMYWIAGLFIGLGCILIIGSNWDSVPAFIKLLGNFAIWGGVLYGVYWSIVNKREKLKELFLTLSFLFVGATIGLIAQIFNLSGGWQSFATGWAILSFVFVIFSRLIVLNIVWLCLFFSILNIEHFFRLLESFLGNNLTMGLITGTLLCAFLSYAGNQLYQAVNKVVVMPKAFAVLSFIHMYIVAVIGGMAVGFKSVFATIFVFVFLGGRLFLAMQNKNMKSFIRNTHLIELYILFLFLTRFGNLFMSGIGFIIGGVLLLGGLYLLKKTSKYIKSMEMFHE